MSVLSVLIPAAAGLVTWAGTGAILGHAPLDDPSPRSSHSIPTPRGGGLAIVLAMLAGMVAGAALGMVEWRLCAAIVGGGGLVALIGWRDDRAGVSPRLRLLFQTAAAVWAVAWCGGYPVMTLGTATVPLGLAGAFLATAGIVWSINLFNFMDGIDGIAGGEALAVGIGGGILLLRSGTTNTAVAPLLMAGAALGFLLWNWAPARIFMGDVGSGFLGFYVALLALWSERSGGPSAVSWAVLGMVFIGDATLTLIRRGVRGARLMEPHRDHAYQRLVDAGWSHSAVSLSVLGVNVVLLGLSFLPPLIGLGVAVLIVGVAYAAVERLRPM